MDSTPAYSDIRVSGERLWNSLMEMAQIGATEKGGVCRLALTDLDGEGRDLLSRWCEPCTQHRDVDAMGNMYFRRDGEETDALPVAMGSHLDSQPTGGKFDGAYGVLAALEVLRTIDENGISTRLPLELVVWTNEEGARFPPAMIGSAVCADVFDLEYGHSRADHEGRTIGDELGRIGYLGESRPGEHRFSAFFEAHIEQGPILEAERKTIGIVTGVQGVNWYDASIEGEETHAGPMPMEMRKDAMRAASTWLPQIYEIAARHAPHARATIGEFRLAPGSRNTVPSRIEFTIDLRHPDESVFDAMDGELKRLAADMDKETNVSVRLDHIWRSPPVSFDDDCVESVRAAGELCGYEAMPITSGAGHDSVNISRVSPVGMIFIPCDDGISHSEIENTSFESVEAGANVLLHAALSQAMR